MEELCNEIQLTNVKCREEEGLFEHDFEEATENEDIIKKREEEFNKRSVEW